MERTPEHRTVGGCIQSLSYWPEVQHALSWTHAREGLLTTAELLIELKS